MLTLLKEKPDDDWVSFQQGRDFCCYYNTWGWRSYPLWQDRNRKGEAPPFAFLKSPEISDMAPRSAHREALSLLADAEEVASC